MLLTNYSGKIYLKLIYILCVILHKITNGNTYKHRKLDQFSDEVVSDDETLFIHFIFLVLLFSFSQ